MDSFVQKSIFKYKLFYNYIQINVLCEKNLQNCGFNLNKIK